VRERDGDKREIEGEEGEGEIERHDERWEDIEQE